LAQAREYQTLLSAAVLGVALVVASAIGACAAERIKASRQAITVTGSAKKQIRSDMIIWRGWVAHQSGDLRSAYADLKSSMATLRAYLAEKGVPSDQIVETPIQTVTLHPMTERGMESSDIIGYRLQQGVEIRSNDVDGITRISREATELINQGIALESMPPEYLYTKIQEAKVEMLAAAARDAKLRAEQVADATGSEIGAVKSARMGVLQITPAFSVEVSDYGINDTSSLEKDITAVVSMEFEID
jgi:hypothetical protein